MCCNKGPVISAEKNSLDRSSDNIWAQEIFKAAELLAHNDIPGLFLKLLDHY